MQCVTLRVSPVLTSTTMIRLPWQCERNRFGYRRHRRSKATLVPSGEKAGEPSIQPSGGWVIWRMWLPLGYIVEMASRRKKTIRPSVEAVSPLVLFLCSWSAPPLAEFPPPQAANNSREQSPMRRPITSTTRRDGFPISEWYIPCFSCPRSSLYLLSLFFSFRVAKCYSQSWLWPNTPPSSYSKRKLNSYSLRSSPLHKGFPRAIGAHCVGERSSEPVPRLNSEFLRSYRLSMLVSSYLVDFAFWQALYGGWCPAVMSTVSRCMSRFGRDNQQDTGVRRMPTCAHGFAETVVISVELRSLATDRAAKLDRGSVAY